jgi:hypothetical protein
MEITTTIGITAATVTLLGAILAASRRVFRAFKSISQRIEKLESALGSKQILVTNKKTIAFSTSTGRAIDLPPGTPLTMQGIDGSTLTAKVFHDEVEVTLMASYTNIKEDEK